MGSRKTDQRAAIYETLKNSKRPLSVQELLEEAQKVYPGLGIATVYRNIKRLLEDDTICRVELQGSVCRYELTELEHHHHFHCQACKKVFDIHACIGNVEQLTPAGFTTDSHEIILYGRCPQC